MTTQAPPRERIIDALAAIENQNGQITPELVLDAASDPQSPLHRSFEWNDETAGHAYRLDQARALIRSVKVEITTTQRTVRTVNYVRDVRAEDEQGYVRLTNVTADGIAEATVAAEVERAVAMVRRGRGIAAALEREQEFIAGVRAALR